MGQAADCVFKTDGHGGKYRGVVSRLAHVALQYIDRFR
jgi:hypothetical protein